MKKYLAPAVTALILSGCTSKTEFGPCVGLFDDKDTAKTYKVSGFNAFMAVVGSAFLFVPTILVIKDETFCPIGNK